MWRVATVVVKQRLRRLDQPGYISLEPPPTLWTSAIRTNSENHFTTMPMLMFMLDGMQWTLDILRIVLTVRLLPVSCVSAGAGPRSG